MKQSYKVYLNPQEAADALHEAAFLKTFSSQEELNDWEDKGSESRSECLVTMAVVDDELFVKVEIERT